MRYEDRGIIPRVISNLFLTMNDASQNGDSYSCYVSYLEIYNSSGYDLLVKDNFKNTTADERIPKVTMQEDEHGAFHFKGLSMHMVSSEEEALDLLFVGDTNRAVAATKMNQNSTRSHCIFTILIEKRKVGCDTVTRSKLNIVDLAGSERVSRTNSDGKILQEAKYINSSLFFLEMVIVALHEKEKKGKDVHIPYRNSMMTSVLRDSLGGNCKTIMVATISPESQHTDESISTCNFAQRVKCVKNKASINEEIEPELVIERLLAEVRRLKEEVEFLSGKNNDGCSNEISEADVNELTQSIERYLQNRDEHSHLDFCGGITISKINMVCSIFKQMLIAQRSERYVDFTPLDINHAPLTQNIADTVQTNAGVNGNDTTSDSRNCNRYVESQKYASEICGVPLCKDNMILDEPANAFAWFKERYPGSVEIELSKNSLKTKYSEAKSTGVLVDEHKRKIDFHQSVIWGEADPSIVKFHNDALEAEKRIYKDTLSKLRDLKCVIENTQEVIETGRLKMQSDFDKWYTSSQQSNPEQIESSVEGSPVKHKYCISERNTQRRQPSYCIHTAPEQLSSHRAAENPAEFKLPPGIKLTGNKEADDDIVAFFKAKELLLSKASSMR